MTSLVALCFVVLLYAEVVIVRSPSSQAAAFAVVIDGVRPKNGAGVRVDVVTQVSARTIGCAKKSKVQMVISGTPAFWRDHSETLKGVHRVGIGLRTSYDNERLLDFSGYDLPDHLGNLDYYDRIPNPKRSGKVRIIAGRDSETKARWYTAEIRDWGEHRTPLVLEFDARWTSRRGLGSCYVVLPELVSIDDTATFDARGAAIQAQSAFQANRDVPNAITFGHVILRANGHISDGESRPAPRLVDGNPWASGLGEIGEEAAVWTCEPPEARDLFPDEGQRSPDGKEIAPDPASAAQVGCGGLAVIEARGAGTVRDLSLLIIGGLFGFIFNRLIKFAVGAIDRLRPKEKSPAVS